jgi:hypothetical protein
MLSLGGCAKELTMASLLLEKPIIVSAGRGTWGLFTPAVAA